MYTAVCSQTESNFSYFGSPKYTLASNKPNLSDRRRYCCVTLAVASLLPGNYHHLLRAFRFTFLNTYFEDLSIFRRLSGPRGSLAAPLFT
jgi:hypothetical protein